MVHQGRPRGPDRALQRPARRVPAPLRAPDRAMGGAARRARGERGRSTPSAAHEYGADIIRACETGEPFTFNGNVPNRCEDGLLIDNLPADCCVEVPCVASARRDRAAAGRRAAAPARGADADQRQRPGPDRRGRADRPPRGDLPGGDARPAHRRRAVAGRDRALWSTICSTRTATGSRRSQTECLHRDEHAAPERRMPREDAKIAFDRERRRRALSRLASRLRFEPDDVSHMLPVRGGRRRARRDQRASTSASR